MYPPRSILKHNHSYHAQPIDITRPNHPAVRFPSSPKMSTVYLTHCPTSYDRRPIVVLPNSCALPDRGCREYDANGASSSSPQGPPQNWGNHVHPSVFDRMCASGSGYPTSSSSDEDGERRHSSSEDAELYTSFSSMMVPSLTHDDGSSEDSDGVASPPPEAAHGLNPYHRHHQYNPPSQSHLHTDPLSHPPIPACQFSDDHRHPGSEYSLSFLPHAPSSDYTPHKKRSDRKKASLTNCAPKASFGRSWAETDEASCLGGF